jgi:hypothetical protein
MFSSIVSNYVGKVARTYSSNNKHESELLPIKNDTLQAQLYGI